MSDLDEDTKWDLPQGYEPTDEEKTLMKKIDDAFLEAKELHRRQRLKHEILGEEELEAGSEQYNFDSVLFLANIVAAFFQDLIPNIDDKCEEMARIATCKDNTECELSVNLELLKKNGINDSDTIRLVLVHEFAHQFMYGRYFFLFPNELWTQELAADLIAGRYSMMFCLNPGKYRYVISSSGPTLTHPDGAIRRDAFDFGRKKTSPDRAIDITQPERILDLLPEFVFNNYERLNTDRERIQNDKL